MFRTLSIGPAIFPTAQLVLIVGFYLGLEIINRYATYRQFRAKTIQNALLAALIGGLIGARLTYVIFNWSAYQTDSLDIIQPSLQGLEVRGGIGVGTLVTLLYAYRTQLPIRPMLDSLAPGIGVMAGVLSVSALAQGDYFGIPTDLPWALDLWGALRHPTQVYLLIGNIIVFGAWFNWQKRNPRSNAGYGFLLISAGNAVNWLVVALLMDAPRLVLDHYRVVQIEMWVVLIVSAFLWNWWSDNPLIYEPPAPEINEQPQQTNAQNQPV